MDYQSNGSNGADETNGLAETTPVFNGSSAVKRVIADPARENVLVLPAGVSLDDIKVEGSNLVIELPDGTEMVVINGAIYVPEIVIDGVTVPPMNLAALLISEEPQPAAGQSQSSGGDFADPVNPIDPAYALGDLLPYTELFFPEPQDEEIIPGLVNEVPEITFIPETGDGTVVDEDGLQGNTDDRPESPGTMDETNDEATTGTILYVSPDGTDRLLIDGMDVFEIVDGELVILEPFVSGYTIGNGTLVINAVDIINGSITYTYTLNDNTSGDNTFVEFDITVIDPDGDSDTGTARIDIVDDNPFTNDDGNLATLDDNAAGVVVGSVAGLLTNDEYGADGAGSPAITIGTGDLGGTIQIVDGNLVYTSGANVAPGETAVETFTYTILDGDGDVSNTSTFTVTLTDEGPSIADLAASIAVDEEGLGGIAGGTGDLAGEATVQSGTLAGIAFGIDGMGDIALAPSADTGLVSAAGNAVSTTWDAASHTLTGQDSVTGETVFTLAITDVSTGAYTFTLLQPVTHAVAGTEDDATFQVTVTVTDAEGDAATGAIAIVIDDDSPVITTVDAAIAAATLDESAAGTDEGGDFNPAGLASITVDYSGNFSLSNTDTSADGFGADVPGSVSYALNLSGSDVASGLFALDGTSIVLNLVDGDIVGTANGDEYVRISVDADTGVVTFTQSANVMHGDTTSDDDTAALLVAEGGLTLTATATDSDGDTSSASIDLGNGTFQIEDDGPKVGAQAIGEGEFIAATDDDGSPNTDSFELSGIFSTTAATSFGTDGAGSLTEVFGLSLLVEGGADSGLFSGGEAITLSLSQTASTATVTGATGEGTVFTITVDKATGTLTLTQSAPIDHAEGSDLAVLANGLVQATYSVTIVDADGDSERASSSIDLGGNVQFNDDTPGIVATGVVPVAVLDESPVGLDEGGDFDPAGRATVDVDFSTAFAPSDATPNATAFGADVPGDVSYALGLDGTDVASGLFTLDGDAIVLNLVGGEIVGTVGGTEYVRISVDADTGVVTFTQSNNVMHGDTTSDDDTASLVVANGALTLTATATDFDGDTASASIDLGNGTFQIEDDGPYATDDGVFTVMEDQPLLNIDVFANDNAGTDGIDLTTGIEVVVEPTKGAVTYNGDGTFNYTPIPGQVGTDTFTYQITDADGDTATAVVTLNLAPDSEPTIVSNDVTVDEDGLAGAVADSGQTDPLEVTSTGSATATGTIVVSYYADVPADPAAAFQFINVDSLDGSISSDGQPVDFSLVGGEIVGTVDGGATTVITIALDGYVAGPNTGDITYTYSAVLSQAIDHANTDNSENTAVISGVSFQVTDSDGDPETGSVDVTIVDDVPAVSNVAVASSVSVDETTAGEAFVNGPISATSTGAIISATLLYGADDAAGAPAYTLSLSGDGTTSLMTSDGDLAITLEQTSDTVISGTYNNGADTAFTVEILADGSLKVTQNVALEHLDPTDDNDTLDLAGLITATVTITDNDGDTDEGSTEVGGAVTFYDDGPAVSNVAVASSVSVDETTAGEAFVNGPISATSTGAIISATLLYGADDAAGAPAYTLSLSGDGTTSLMTSDGDLAITLEQTSDTVISGTYNNGADTAFTVEILADGSLKVTQNVALEHLDPTDDNDTLDLAGLITATVTITDNDGDTDEGSTEVGGAVTFYDDGPAVSNVAVASSVSVDETTAGEAFVNGPISATSTGAIISATLLYGADDAAGAPAYTLSLSGDGTTSLMTSDGDLAITLEQTSGTVISGTYNNGADTAFTVEILADGSLKVTQNVALEHLDPTDDNDTLDLAGLITATVTITDNDGDTDEGSTEVGGAVTFYDDGPAVSNVAVASSVSVDETTAGEAFVNGPISATSTGAIISATLLYGADDAAGAPAYTLSLSGDGTTSLMTSDGDLAITLEQTSDTVISGTYNNGADTAFTVEILADGSLKVTQNVALEHLDPTDDNDTLDLAGLITATVTITDNDGDTDEGSTEVGGAVTFYDDGPAVSNVAVASSVSVDETTAGEAFVNGPISATSTGAIISATLLYGADDAAGAPAYTLSLSGDGTTSLMTSDGDLAITLEQTSDTVISGTYNNGADTAFTVEILADGSLKVTQNVALEHLDPTDDNDTLDLAGLITATVTITDNDGDTDEGSTEVGGAVTFYDDGPAVSNVAVASSVSVDETTAGEAFVNGPISATSTGAIISATLLYGADDAAGAPAYTLSLSGDGTTSLMTSDGDLAITLEQTSDTVISGTYNNGADTAFTVEILADGSLKVTQNVALEHLDPTDDNDTLDLAGLITATVTITDNDGDTDEGSTEVGGAVTFYDDGPAIAAAAAIDAGVAITSDAALPDQDASSLSLADIFGYEGALYGADGAGSLTETFGLALQVAEGGDSGLNSGGDDILLFTTTDTTGTVVISGATDSNDVAGTTVFTITVNKATGALTLDQFGTIDHIEGGSFDDQIPLADLKIQGTYSVTIVDADGDSETATQTVDLGGNIAFNDDNPDINAQGDIGTLTLDESPLPADGGDGVYFATQNLAANFTFTNADVNAAGWGADGPGTVTYALNLSVQDVESGLFVLDDSDTATPGKGEAIKLYQDPSGIVLGYIGDSPSDVNGTHEVLFFIAAGSNNGQLTITYSDQTDPANIWHGDTTSDDDASAIQLAANVLTLVATATDFDGDTDTASIDLGQSHFVFEDDGPAITTPIEDSQFAEIASVTYPLEATGAFAFDIGTDGLLDGKIDTAMTFNLTGGTVAGVAISNISDPTFDPITATWTFSFDYVDNDGSTQTANGFIDYDLGTEQYTVGLDTNFEFTSIVPFSDIISRDGYNLAGSSPSQYEIVVSELNADEPTFVQFQAYAGNLSAGGNTVLSAGETAFGDLSWASISNDANGVAGDTIQRYEVLDFDLFDYDPGGIYSDSGNLFVNGLTIQIDGFGNEDLIVVLKLVDADDPTITTTKIMIVGTEDVYTAGDVIGNYTPTLDNNDGFIVIEENDFNGANENWLISGAQLLSSSAGLSSSSTGIQLNGAVGANGGTNQVEVTFASVGNTNDTDVVKISDIGLIQTRTDAQAVSLDFDVTVTDADGDTETDSFTINPVVPPVVLDLDGDGIELVGMEAGMTYDYGNGEVATAWVGGEDGILFHDNDGNGVVSGAEEFVFGGDGLTDLEALAANYDGNGDGVLSGSELDGFGVWMADGSVATAEALGITEISLSTEGQGYMAAGGDATVFGEGSFVMDGEEHVLADVGFATSSDYEGEPADSQLRQAEAALLAAAVPGLLVSTALDTTPLFDAPEMVNFEPTDIDFAMAVNAITPVDVDLSHVSPMANMPGNSAAISMADHSSHFSDETSSASRSTFNAANDAPKMDVADLGHSSEAGAEFVGASHAANGGVSGDVLEALLSIGVPAEDGAEGVQGTGAMDAVRVALQEVTATDDITALVNHVVDNAPESAQHGSVGTEIMEALLNSGVAGQHFQMAALPDGADDAAHLAVAAA